ncbi:MAG TPA: 50S ribosomal protein L2 [Spirochaetia bacterium]|nr:50S ribosomal protein L2 [Spirochaetales bacterium]HRS66185.1 50S ribosomal protein L2 [Spirochaetia bacterium]HOT59050.1 50S ribosomal protein L2 [Spirochaetales bacterium]HPD81191.1 50S ribosomal protein L2 [Spirochaetales bacterium]HQK35758.1 50S ribosomal protein L2 [Spirochaetales bacterium]
MAIRTFKPITPGQRHRIQVINEEITTGNNPERSLTKGKKQTAGRASNGRISSRRKGGGHKRKLRVIDWRRDKFNIPGKVATIEYDPNRSANIALINYVDGEKRYIVAPKGLKVGQQVISGEKAPLEVGNAMLLENIPVGFTVHNVELNLGKGGQLVRSAGAGAMIVGTDGDYVILRMPSNELRMVYKKCMATIGSVGNEDHMNERFGKAGRIRWLGKRPRVRGVAMNPVDHPHGGGEGRGKGYKQPVTPWGQPCKGYKTRDPHKPSSSFIVKRRK